MANRSPLTGRATAHTTRRPKNRRSRPAPVDRAGAEDLGERPIEERDVWSVSSRSRPRCAARLGCEHDDACASAASPTRAMALGLEPAPCSMTSSGAGRSAAITRGMRSRPSRSPPAPSGLMPAAGIRGWVPARPCGQYALRMGTSGPGMSGSGSRAPLRPAPCANAAFRAGVHSAARARREREYAPFPVKNRTAGRAAIRADEPYLTLPPQAGRIGEGQARSVGNVRSQKRPEPRSSGMTGQAADRAREDQMPREYSRCLGVAFATWLPVVAMLTALQAVDLLTVSSAFTAAAATLVLAMLIALAFAASLAAARREAHRETGRDQPPPVPSATPRRRRCSRARSGRVCCGCARGHDTRPGRRPRRGSRRPRRSSPRYPTRCC